MSRMNLCNPLVLCRPTASRSDQSAEEENEKDKKKKKSESEVRYMCPSRIRPRTVVQREAGSKQSRGERRTREMRDGGGQPRR